MRIGATNAPADNMAYMTLYIEPEMAIPLPELDQTEPYIELRDRLNSLCNTTAHLMQSGLAAGELTPEDKDEAIKIARAYTKDEKHTSKKVTTKRAAMLTPQAVLYTTSILNEFGQAVAESSAMIRNLVTHKLIHETENTDPRVRLKALELLGKLSDVGLFTDKSEITITHQTTDDLKRGLRDKLEKLINPEPKMLRSTSGEIIDVDLESELGIE